MQRISDVFSDILSLFQVLKLLLFGNSLASDLTWHPRPHSEAKHTSGIVQSLIGAKLRVIINCALLSFCIGFGMCKNFNFTSFSSFYTDANYSCVIPTQMTDCINFLVDNNRLHYIYCAIASYWPTAP